jgi:hypothetical protein
MYEVTHVAAFKSEIDVPLIVTVGVISFILVVVLIVGTEAWYDSEAQAEFNFEADAYPNTELLSLKAGQLANINSYRWVDQKKGIVAIPIEDAIKIMVQSGGHPPSAD